MIRSYFVLSCHCKLKGTIGSKFDSNSKKFDNYPTRQEIEAYIDELIEKGFKVYHTSVHKRYEKVTNESEVKEDPITEKQLTEFEGQPLKYDYVCTDGENKGMRAALVDGIQSGVHDVEVRYENGDVLYTKFFKFIMDHERKK